MKNKILPPPILMPCEVKGSFTVSPTSYTFKPTDKIVINYSHTSKIDYGYLYGLTDDVVFSESSTTNTITFPSNSKEGTYNCYIGTYENATDWIESNRFTITIGNSTPPPTDNAPTVNSISDIATKVNQTVAITYIATDDNGIVKHELSQNGGSSFSVINPTKNGNTYTHTLSYSSVGNRQCKIRVTDAKNQSATSNNFTISVTEDTVDPPPTQNRPPAISGISVSSITSSGSYKLNYTINDADNDKMTVELKVGSQAYKVIANNQSNGAKVYNGYGLSQGNHTCYLKVSDGTTSTTSSSFSINVSGGSSNGLQAKWEAYTSTLQALREAMHNATVKIAQVKADESVETSKTYTESKFTILNDSIKAKVSQTEYDSNKNVVSEKLSKLEIDVDGVTTEVSKKLNSSDLSSKIQQSATDIKIGFNGIDNRIEMTNDGMFFNNANSKRTISLKRGYMHLYNPADATLMGATVPRNITGGGVYDNGMTTVVASNGYFYSVARANDWSNDNQATFTPSEYFVLNFRSRGQDISKQMGGHFHTPLFAHDGLNCGGSNISNANVCTALTMSANEYHHPSGKKLFSSDGWVINNNVGWDWKFQNLLDPVIIGGKYGVSVINNQVATKASNGDTFDEIEIISPLAKSSEKKLDVSNVTNKEEVLLNEENADLSKLVTLLFDEVKKLKNEIEILKAR